MSSEQSSLIVSYPFVRKFVYAILQNVRAENLVRDEKFVIHADLVPKVSERVMRASLGRNMTRGYGRQVVGNRVPVAPPRVPIRRVMPQQLRAVSPPVSGDVGLSQDYGKIMPLLNDASVSTIECQGTGKPLMVIRAGQRQITRIALSAAEIKEILEKVSDAVHIPILEGVFRAAVDNFSINAVVSEIIGSRFVIKKKNAYALLE